MTSLGPYRRSAEMQNRGFCEMKFSGAVWMLVKLQRPPPEMRIFSPAALACSMTSTRRPRLPASMAHIMPAAPAPITTTSYRSKSASPASSEMARTFSLQMESTEGKRL